MICFILSLPEAGSLLVLPQPYLAQILAPWILQVGTRTETWQINGASLDQDLSRSLIPVRQLLQNKTPTWMAFYRVYWGLPTNFEIICFFVYFCRRLCHPGLQRSPEAFSNGTDPCPGHPNGWRSSDLQATQDGHPSGGREETTTTDP